MDQIHPGAAVALARFGMTEMDVAKAIAAGELASPQKFENSWLFALRISGTGAAYRERHSEYVWRDPDYYVSEEFLERCNGLPVIVDHPPTQVLNTEEYANRSVGAIVYPFVPAKERPWDEDAPSDEPWGIARILDARIAGVLERGEFSTSPAVGFDPDRNENKWVDLKDGQHVLIEGVPKLLDHLALCFEGVWDRDNGPGVDVSATTEEPAARGDSTGDSLMASDDKKDDRRDDKKDDRRDDANPGETPDKILAGLDALSKKLEDKARDDAKWREDMSRRMDAMESDRRGDKKRTDEDPEEEKRQAAELEKLAAEEKKEAAEGDKRKDAKAEDDKKRDDAKAEDDKRDDDDDKKREDAKAEDDKKRGDKMMTARHALRRRSDESEEEHSQRVDRVAKARRRADLGCKDDESRSMHSRRVDSAEEKDLDEPKKSESSEDKRKDSSRGDDDNRHGDDDRHRDDSVARTVSELDALIRDKVIPGILTLDRRTKEPTTELRAAFADAQMRADRAYSALGLEAPSKMAGENLLSYRARLLRGVQDHSAKYKGKDLLKVAESVPDLFESVEAEVYADAVSASKNPASVPSGTMQRIERRQPGTNVTITEWRGSTKPLIDMFSTPYRCCTNLDPQGARR